jgi:predicted metal-dependent phosphoesterase TrpH
LQKAGIPLDYEQVLARTDGIPNRAHFAAELTRMGITGSIKEAIHSYLSPKNGLYVPPLHPATLEIIGIVRDLGAVSVLAHPFLNMKEPRLREFLSQAKHLDAMETLYTDFTPELIQKAQTIAAEFHLKQSGGTDYHGAQKPHIQLGQTKVPLAFLEALEAIRN